MDSSTNSNSTSNQIPNAAPNMAAGPAPGPAAGQNLASTQNPSNVGGATWGGPTGMAAAGLSNLGSTGMAVPDLSATAPAANTTASPNPAMGAATGGGVSNVPTPVNPIIQPTNSGTMNPAMMAAPRFDGIAATDPIMKPEPLPEPDPVEEELKAPMKAAAPAPGSIGSAVSGVGEKPVTNPFDDKQNVPNGVPNTNPVEPQLNAANVPNGKDKPEKKKNNKMTLIILIAVAAVIVIVLLIILIMQITGGSKPVTPATSSTSSTGSNVGGANAEDEEDTEEVEESEEETISILACVRSMDEAELVNYAEAVTGSIKIEANYDDDLALEDIMITKTIEYGEPAEEGAEQQPADVEIIQAVADEITEQNMGSYYLNADKDGEPYKTLGEMKVNYEVLAFSCETL